jgi:hypothetical protein
MQNVLLVHESPLRESLLPVTAGEAAAPAPLIRGPVLAVAAVAGSTSASTAMAAVELTIMRERNRRIVGLP